MAKKKSKKPSKKAPKKARKKNDIVSTQPMTGRVGRLHYKGRKPEGPVLLQEPVNPNAPTATVRIAVAVDSKGRWHAAGWNNGKLTERDAIETRNVAIEGLAYREDEQAPYHIVWIEATVPLAGDALRSGQSVSTEPAPTSGDAPAPASESLEMQVDRLAKFIMAEVPGEPSQNEGAIDTAIRVLREWKPVKRADLTGDTSVGVVQPSATTGPTT